MSEERSNAKTHRTLEVGSDSSGSQCCLRNEVLERAIDKVLRMGASVGVSADQMTEMLDSGMPIEELLRYVVSLKQRFADRAVFAKIEIGLRKDTAMNRKACELFLTFFVIVCLIVFVSPARAQAQSGGQTASNASSSNASQGSVDPTSGKQLYTAYCALCHGPEGKGGGPFSPQLKVWPPDLTQLLKGNHGIFPEMRVSEAIDGEYGKPSHGSAEMPIWGPVFRSMAHGKRDSAQVRINSLVKYVESIQEK